MKRKETARMTDTQAAQSIPEGLQRSIIYLVCFAIPPLGIATGLCFFRSENREDRKFGTFCLIGSCFVLPLFCVGVIDWLGYTGEFESMLRSLAGHGRD